MTKGGWIILIILIALIVIAIVIGIIVWATRRSAVATAAVASSALDRPVVLATNAAGVTTQPATIVTAPGITQPAAVTTAPIITGASRRQGTSRRAGAEPSYRRMVLGRQG